MFVFLRLEDALNEFHCIFHVYSTKFHVLALKIIVLLVSMTFKSDH